MSNLFLKNNIKKNIYKNSHNFESNGGSITSSNNISKINSADINNLLSMLTSENSNDTSTSQLENKLKNLLVQEGGNITETTNTEMLEQKINKLLAQQGGNTETVNTEMANTEILEKKINNLMKTTQSGGANIAKGIITLAALGAAGTYLSKKPVDTETEFNSSNILKNNNSQVNNAFHADHTNHNNHTDKSSTTSSEMHVNANLSDTSDNLASQMNKKSPTTNYVELANKISENNMNTTTSINDTRLNDLNRMSNKL